MRRTPSSPRAISRRGCASPIPRSVARAASGRGGGESGGGRGAQGDDPGGDSGDEVDRAQQEAEQDLERLAQEHAGEIAKMEQALNEAASDDDLKAMREEAKKHADAVREAVKELPTVGQGSDSWTSKGAAARELGEQMAEVARGPAPRRRDPERPQREGALDEAKKMLQKQAWLEDPTGDEKRAGRRGAPQARRRTEVGRGAARADAPKAAERARKDLEKGGRGGGQAGRARARAGRRSRDKGSCRSRPSSRCRTPSARRTRPPRR